MILSARDSTGSVRFVPNRLRTIAWDGCGQRTPEEDPGVRPRDGGQAVEDSCRKNGISRVTTEELERIRARMPTPKMFR